MTAPAIPFVDLGAQYRSIEKEVQDAMRQVMESSGFILGAPLVKFEQDFARYVGTKHCIGVANGLEALRLSLWGLGIGPGDEVVVQANTYIASAFAISAVGATPVLVDSDPRTQQIDASRVEAALTPRTKAIMPVHLTGMSADMDPLLDVARRHGLKVVEDSAQSHGTRYKGRVCGSMGDAGCFSFYPGKNLGAYGDGGAITTDDDALAKKLRRLRNFGQDVKYVHLEKGWNARLDTLQAAVLNVKLPRLDGWNERRARHAARYRELLKGVGDLAFQDTVPGSTHTHHLFIVHTERRDALREHLARRGVDTVMHYPIPVHLQEAYRELGHKRGDFPNAERHSDRTLSLPMFAELTDEQVGRVAAAVREFYGSDSTTSVKR